jgi:hypothetical protein
VYFVLIQIRFFSYFSSSFFTFFLLSYYFLFNPLNCLTYLLLNLAIIHLLNNFSLYSPCMHLFMVFDSFAIISLLYSLQSLIFLPSFLLTHFLEFSYSNNHFCYYTSLALLSSFLFSLLSSIFILFSHSSFLQFSFTDFSLVYCSAFAQIFPRSQPTRESNTSNRTSLVSYRFSIRCKSGKRADGKYCSD